MDSGIDYRIIDSDPWILHVGPRLGVLIHSFGIENGDSGSRFNVVAGLATGIGLRLGSTWILGVTSGLGFADSGRMHRRGTEILWERGPIRFETALVVSAEF